MAEALRIAARALLDELGLDPTKKSAVKTAERALEAFAEGAVDVERARCLFHVERWANCSEEDLDMWKNAIEAVRDGAPAKPFPHEVNRGK